MGADNFNAQKREFLKPHALWRIRPMLMLLFITKALAALVNKNKTSIFF